MSKCEQCIVREFSSLKALNKEELTGGLQDFTNYKKGEVIFEEGENVNGIFCIKTAFVN
jgi:CRP-like cAMP-binding protein